MNGEGSSSAGGILSSLSIFNRKLDSGEVFLTGGVSAVGETL